MTSTTVDTQCGSSQQATNLAYALVASGVVDVFVWLTVIGTVLGFTAQFAWFLDLFAHFRVQYAVAFLVGLVFAAWAGPDGAVDPAPSSTSGTTADSATSATPVSKKSLPGVFSGFEPSFEHVF